MQQGDVSIQQARLALRATVLIALWCAACLATPAFAQNVRFVRASATPGGNGLTWTTAYNDLQTALTAAAANPSITQLWLASGTYKPAAPGGRRTATFQLRNNLALYGGFNGSESNLAQRNIALNVTTLSGDLNGDDLDNPSSVPPWLADNSFHVVSANGVGATARLDGVTVRGGAAILTTLPNNGGGGLECVNGSPVIDQCVFTRNYALHRGGAINLRDADHAAITRCTFSFNRTFTNAAIDDGGGAICLAASDALISDCTFTSNRGVGSGPTLGGGAIRNNLGAPTIERCTFTSNRHNNFGGAIDNADGNPLISRCTFALNQALYGGGVRSGGGAVTIRDCTFQTGFAVDIGDGSYFDGGSHLVVNSVFDRMQAGDGGAAIAMSSGAAATVVNCGFFGNVAGLFGGGAIWNLDETNPAATLTIVNSVFSGNRCTSSGARGGAILTESAATTLISNCTFASNTVAAGATGGVAVHTTGAGSLLVRNSIVVHSTPLAFAATAGGQINVRYSCIEGGWTGPGNIATSNPGFADDNGADNLLGTSDDDLRLISTSPCIDAGRNVDVLPDYADLDNDGDTAEPTPLDLRLFGRMYDAVATIDTGSGTAPLVDMGCHEYRLPCAGDVTVPHDGLVNTDDLLAVLIGWGPCANCAACPADIAPSVPNCQVDTDDLLALMSSWGVCP